MKANFIIIIIILIAFSCSKNNQTKDNLDFTRENQILKMGVWGQKMISTVSDYPMIEAYDSKGNLLKTKYDNTLYPSYSKLSKISIGIDSMYYNGAKKVSNYLIFGGSIFDLPDIVNVKSPLVPTYYQGKNKAVSLYASYLSGSQNIDVIIESDTQLTAVYKIEYSDNGWVQSDGTSFYLRQTFTKKWPHQISLDIFESY